MENRSPDRNPLRTLLICIVGGCSFFILLLLAVHLMILLYVPMKFDSSVLGFYPVMAGLGAVFGIERWLSYEQGPYNPFHEH